MKIHTGEKTHQCSQCDSISTKKGSYNTHEDAHAGEKHQCSECENAFTYRSHLTEHMRAQTGETVSM